MNNGIWDDLGVSFLIALRCINDTRVGGHWGHIHNLRNDATFRHFFVVSKDVQSPALPGFYPWRWFDRSCWPPLWLEAWHGWESWCPAEWPRRPRQKLLKNVRQQLLPFLEDVLEFGLAMDGRLQNTLQMTTAIVHYYPEQTRQEPVRFVAESTRYLQPSAFRRPSSLLPVCRLQKAFVSKMSLCKSRACIKAMLV